MGLTSPFAAGASITAAALASVAPLAGFKFADQNSGQSNTSLVDDTDLSVAMLASGTYVFFGFIIYAASTAADYQAAFTVPSNAQLNWGPYPFIGTGGSSYSTPQNVITGSGTAQAMGGQGTAQNQVATLIGSVVMGAVAGDLQYQFAQNSSDASNCNTRAGSFLLAWQIA
jgi:hypothetical protein